MQNLQSNEKISVITICYNAEKTIERTIKSVLNQSYKNLEYIIIDGGSKDNTMKIVKRYKDKISSVISEPDNGIYDAMNKGVRIATGEWLNMMNAGDCYTNDEVLNLDNLKKHKVEISNMISDIGVLKDYKNLKFN